MLFGKFPAKIDEKSRIRLPAEFRRELPETVDNTYYVTSFDGTRAMVYPIPVWECIARKLQAAPRMDPAKLKLKDIISYYGTLSKMDPQGRILIPLDLREDAQLSDDVLVLGETDHLEVVNKQTLGRKIKENPLTLEDWEKLGAFGILDSEAPMKQS